MAIQKRKPKQAHDSSLELANLISKACTADGSSEPIPGVFLYRCSSPTQPLHNVSEPSFCVIAQGSKEVTLGETKYVYDPARFLISTVELPVISRVTKATQEKPYLSFRLRLDPGVVSSVIIEAGLEPLSKGDAKAINVSPLDPELSNAVVRIMRLIDSPSDARMLGPLITREIIYRLLQSEQGMRLRHLVSAGGHVHQMAKAVEKLRQQFNKPLSIEKMAKEFGMSPSGFHQHFKAVTAMSPLQFQKQIRLQEAKRLMLSENLDATNAGYRVGYDNAGHFSREYKKHFGEPPIRDIERIREISR